MKADDRHITFLEGEDIGAWLKAQEGVLAFRYRPNTISNWFLAAGMLAGLYAAWGFYRGAWANPWLQAVAVLTALLGALFCAWAFVHVSLFTVRAYVALSPNGLMYGRGGRAFVIPHALLNRDHIRWERIRVGPMWMRLPVELHDWRVSIPLLNPLFHVRDLSTLIAALLHAMLPADALADAEEAAELADGTMDEVTGESEATAPQVEGSHA
jgi:hypothetical protein